jgi:hypothetical protein
MNTVINPTYLCYQCFVTGEQVLELVSKAGLQGACTPRGLVAERTEARANLQGSTVSAPTPQASGTASDLYSRGHVMTQSMLCGNTLKLVPTCGQHAANRQPPSASVTVEHSP